MKGLRIKGERYLDSSFPCPAGDKFIIAEVGSPESYDRYHIQRAVYFPLEEIRKNARTWIPSLGCEIILYGDRKMVPEAIRILSAQGYQNLYVYLGGKEEWKNAGLSIRSSLVPASHFDYGSRVPAAGYHQPADIPSTHRGENKPAA